MRNISIVSIAIALSACSESPVAADGNVAAREDAPTAALMASLNETTWTYTDNGRLVQETIDGRGNYVSTSGDEHVDHGTVEMIDGKACFTTAIHEAAPTCWMVPETAIGETKQYTNDRGGKLTVTRVAYVPPKPTRRRN